MKKRSRRLLSIAVVLLVVFGAVVVVANLQNATNRRAYGQTELTLMGNGLLLEIYRRNHGGYPSPGYDGSLKDLPVGPGLTNLATDLGARYAWAVTDGWGRALWYLASSDGEHYALVSMGSDSEPDVTVDFQPGQPTNLETFQEDVVFQDGRFQHWWGGWCCNPAYQQEDLEELKRKVAEGALG